MKYPKIRNVKVLDDYFLEVTFKNNITKLYDCKPLLLNTIFERLKNYSIFRFAENNSSPYGVIWDDELDLAESEIWINGKEIKKHCLT
jgi:hypothetical protein